MKSIKLIAVTCLLTGLAACNTDKEIATYEGDPNAIQIEAVIGRCPYCMLGLVDKEGKPYVVPMNFAWEDGHVYLHSGREKDISRLMEKIDELTPEDLQDVAREIFDPGTITTLMFV